VLCVVVGVRAQRGQRGSLSESSESELSLVRSGSPAFVVVVALRIESASVNGGRLVVVVPSSLA
jgi:hypothetical protein